MSDYKEVLELASPDVAELARRTRDLILKVMPDVVEVVWPKQKIMSYGVGPKKMSEHFCYIGVMKEHVNLGFYYGADLKAPAGMMEGSGKALRHVKITSLGQLERPDLLRLIKAASVHLPKVGKVR